MIEFNERRRVVTMGLALGAAVLSGSAASAEKSKQEREVLANEDLMREHGLLRRILLIYTVAAGRLRSGKDKIPANALGRAAGVFRTFGGDYHERMLEEKYVFPTVSRSKGAASELPRVLELQHQRGRAINEYVTSVTQSGNIGAADVLPLADVLNGFVLMYRRHAVMEDTVVFPAWRDALPEQQYRELSERFEKLEHQTFGQDGFEEMLKRVAAVETEFGIADLKVFTPPPPPKHS